MIAPTHDPNLHPIADPFEHINERVTLLLVRHVSRSHSPPAFAAWMPSASMVEVPKVSVRTTVLVKSTQQIHWVQLYRGGPFGAGQSVLNARAGSIDAARRAGNTAASMALTMSTAAA